MLMERCAHQIVVLEVGDVLLVLCTPRPGQVHDVDGVLSPLPLPLPGRPAREFSRLLVCTHSVRPSAGRRP